MYTAEHAKEHPDQPLFIMADSGTVVTYAQFEAGTNRLAQLFRSQGLQRHDHVAFFMENNPCLLEAEGAAERTGLYFTCVNSYLSVDEASYVVNDSQARVFVTSAAKQEVAGKLPPLCPNVERWLITDVPSAATIPEGFERYEEAVSRYPSDPVPDEQLGMSMPYSSGTTGRPKGILRPLPDEHPGRPQPRLVRSGHRRVLRRYRVERLHLVRLQRVARAPRHRRAAGPRRAPHPRREGERLPAGCPRHSLVRRRDHLRVLQRPRQDRRVT